MRADSESTHKSILPSLMSLLRILVLPTYLGLKLIIDCKSMLRGTIVIGLVPTYFLSFLYPDTTIASEVQLAVGSVCVCMCAVHDVM